LFKARGAKTSNKAKELMDAGFLGRKNRKGFYIYEEGSKKKKKVNTEVYRFFGGEDRQKFKIEEIQQRLAMIMVKEAVLCLHEGILQKPEDGDLGAILGLGFPPFLGGPFRYLESMGIEVAADLLDTLESDHGPRFNPPDRLEDMADNNERFYN